MVWLPKMRPARWPTIRLAVGIVMSSAFAITAFAGSAVAEDRRDEHRGEDHRGYRHNWNGGYYRSPPVVYGSPYYYPPPVVYGPGIGLNFIIR